MPLYEVEGVGAAVLGDERNVGAARGVRLKILDGGVGSFDPSEFARFLRYGSLGLEYICCDLPVSVVSEPSRIVDVHLD